MADRPSMEAPRINETAKPTTSEEPRSNLHWWAMGLLATSLADPVIFFPMAVAAFVLSMLACAQTQEFSYRLVLSIVVAVVSWIYMLGLPEAWQNELLWKMSN